MNACVRLHIELSVELVVRGWCVCFHSGVSWNDLFTDLTLLCFLVSMATLSFCNWSIPGSIKVVIHIIAYLSFHSKSIQRGID